MAEYVFDYGQYKKNINKRSSSSFVLLITFVILLFGLAMFLYPKKINTFEFYFVEVDCFQTYKQANNLSQELQTSNAPGYIYFDGNYHVLACFFNNYDNAKTVAENLKTSYENADVFTITSEQINKKNFSFDPNKSINNLVLSTNKIINKICELSIEYDKQNVSYNALSLQLTEIYEANYKNFNNFFDYFKNNHELNSAKKYATDINTSLNFLQGCEADSIAYNLKNELIKIVVNHSLFLSCF